MAALVFAAMAVAVLATGPDSQADAIDSAIRSASINEFTAESAPQQQVVNGWVARDLLEIQADQIDELNASTRTTNLLLAGLVALVVFLAARPTRNTTPSIV